METPNLDQCFSTVATVDGFNLTIFIGIDDCIVYGPLGRKILEDWLKLFAKEFSRQLEKCDIATYKIVVSPYEKVIAQGKINEINSEEAFINVLREEMRKEVEEWEDKQLDKDQ